MTGVGEVEVEEAAYNDSWTHLLDRIVANY